MDVQQLRCFLAVAHERHFGRAAERLHLTTSPVSRAVKDLERELGAELFLRHHHRVELTAAGRHLLLLSEPLVADFDRLPAEVRRVATARTVNVGGTHLAPPAILDAVVEAAEKACPDRRVEVVLGPSSELLPALGRGEIDVAVVHLPVEDPSLSTMPLADYALNAVLRRDDPLAARTEVSLSDLADHTFVTMAGSVQPVAMSRMHDELVARGITKFVYVPAADILMIAAKVRRPGAVTLAPVGAGAGRVFEDPDLATVSVADAPVMHLGLAWRDAAERSDHVVCAVVAQVRVGRH